ncbi:MAG: acyl-CoA thioesterase domain-containing protein [Leucobacter sp.]
MPSQSRAHFGLTSDPDLFEVLSPLRSGWNPEQMLGPAITGLLARGAIAKAAELNLQSMLVRAVYDLHSIAKLVPTRVVTEVVKRGRRVTLIEVKLMQENREVARGHMYFATTAERPEGQLWQPEFPFCAPEVGYSLNKSHQLYFTETTGWTNDAISIVGNSRKAVWVENVEFVQGEPMSGALLAGYAADLTSATANWGTLGVSYINIDATMTLTREPIGEGIGLYSTFSSEGEGLTAGSAIVFDRSGTLGVATVAGVAQRVAVNPANW